MDSFNVFEQFNNGTKTFGTLKEITLDKLLNIEDQEKKHIVFIDGYVRTELDHKEHFKDCQNWLSKKANRRLVVICSMTSVGKMNLDEKTLYNVKEFLINSWTIQEYYDSCKSDEFFESIKNKLDSLIKENERNELIDSIFMKSMKKKSFLLFQNMQQVKFH